MPFQICDPSQSIAALACSLLRHYTLCPPNPSLSAADRLLENAPRNVVLLLLDGMGTDILERHLPNTSFLRRNLSCEISSVFPPTTTAAATALESGMFPAQHGWLGWSVYWRELDKNVNLYPNTDETGCAAAPVHLGSTYLAYRSLTQRIKEEAGVPALALHENGDISVSTCGELCSEISLLCSEPGPHFIYGYLNQPDGLLHKEGCASHKVTQMLESFNEQLEALCGQLSDTLVLITADHGLIDTHSLCLEDYPALLDTLVRLPSIEPRALNCFVRRGREEQFCEELRRATENTYQIYSHRQVMEQALFGPGMPHPRFDAMVGDYIAVAQTALTLFPTRSYQNSMIAAHGGMTKEEFTVPLIAIRCPTR